MVHRLIGIYAARQIGARGATEQQYLEPLLTTTSTLASLRLHHQLGPAFFREAEDLAKACAFQPDADAAPLCSQVQWTVGEVTAEVRELLQDQTDIEVVGPSP